MSAIALLASGLASWAYIEMQHAAGREAATLEVLQVQNQWLEYGAEKYERLTLAHGACMDSLGL